MPYEAHYQLTLRCRDADVLFHTALDRARAAGITADAYAEARRRAPHELAFDVETLLGAALAEAGCRITAFGRIARIVGEEPARRSG